MDIRHIVTQYLREAKLMQICTSVEYQPWCVSVWFVSDENFQLYWISKKTRRHSQELVYNNKVAGTVVLGQVPDDTPRAIQFEGVAEQVCDEIEIQKARDLYIGRIFSKEKVDTLTQFSDDSHIWYVVRPTLLVLFDALNFPDQPRQEIKI